MLKKYNFLIQDVLNYVGKITKSDDEDINKIIKEYFFVGGKRVRVYLSLICSELGDFNSNREDIIRLAAIVEIIHTASLIHDDIIDNAEIRRGNTTLNKLYGNNFALFLGDYLFSVVLNEVSKINKTLLHEYMSNTLKELCVGEIIQNKELYDLTTRRIDYLKKIKRKTAILIAFACVGGAIVSEAETKYIRASYKYGYYIGMSYQIIDDYLDYMGGIESLGKEAGQDLKNGNLTLPAILFKEKYPNYFENYSKDSKEEEKEQLINSIIKEKQVLLETLELSKRYSQKARYIIKDYPNDIKEKLIFILDNLLKRDK